MRLQSLSHVVNIAAAIAPGRRIVVLGSSSLLASFPHLGEAAGLVEPSRDADLLIEGVDAELAGVVRESIGEGSLFEAKEGYFADTLRPPIAETLPRGWEERLVALPGCAAAFCLDPHDLAAVKMQAGRPKDLALCAALLSSRRLDASLIEERLHATRMTERMIILSQQRLREVIAMAQTLETSS